MPCAPGMRRCKSGCLHRRMVEEYRLARHAQLLRAEAAGAFAGEQESRSYFGDGSAPTWADAEPPLTFRAWLEGRAHQQEEACSY